MPRRLFRFGLRRLLPRRFFRRRRCGPGLVWHGFACPGLLQPGASCGQLFLQLRRAGRLACGPAHGIGQRPVLSLFHGRIRHHQRHARIFFAQHQPQRQRRQRAGRGHHLADAEGAHHQAVGAQALDEKPPQAVPHHIHQHHFAMEAAVLFIGGQQQKAHQAPKRFVQKRGVHGQVGVYRDALRGQRGLHRGKVGRGVFAYHAPGQRGVGAEGLLVDKVAPAANALANQKAHGRQVKHGQHRHLAPFAQKPARYKRRNNGAVNAHAAQADVQHLGKAFVFKRRCGHIIGAPANDGAHRGAEDDVHHAVGVNAVASGLPEREQQRQQKPAGNQNAVPVHGHAEQREGHAVQRERKPQAGELHMIGHWSASCFSRG